jgi:hypothetical protein
VKNWIRRYNPAFLFALALSIVLILIGVRVLTTRDPGGRVTVAVLSDAVRQHTKIEPTNVRDKQIDRGEVAAGVVRGADGLVGRTALVGLARDTPVSAADVTTHPPDVLEDRQRLGIPLSADVTVSETFRGGDFVDLLLSPTGDVPAGGTVLRGVPVLSLSSGAGKSLFVALRREELDVLADYSGRASVSVVRSA